MTLSETAVGSASDAHRDDIAAKLWRSSSVQSLIAERSAAAVLSDAGWRTALSVHYRDIATDKTREIDVIGTRTAASVEIPRASVDVRVLVEVKTLRDAHIVFLPDQTKGRTSPTSYSWLGNRAEHLDRVKQVVTPKATFAGREQEVHDRVTSIAFPGGIASIASLLVAPMPATLYASGFRETNTKVERGSFDGFEDFRRAQPQSVLWNAARELWSATGSLKREFVIERYEDLEAAVEDALRRNKWLIVEEDQTPLRRALEHAALYHPVVLLESHLWAVGNSSLEEVGWFRLQLINASGRASNSWCDVVTTSEFPHYVGALTWYYKELLQSAGAVVT